MLRYLTAGESHGPQITAIVSGFPAGVPVTASEINRDLSRRQKGYGRGGRMKIEKDTVEILSGVRFGKSMGSPVTLVVRNLDYETWREVMSPERGEPEEAHQVTRPRPGHADLAGCLKYGCKDARNILERASARETAVRVAVGALCKQLLSEFGMAVFSHVIQIGRVTSSVAGLTLQEIQERAEASEVRCADSAAAGEMKRIITEAAENGDTVGGVVEVIATGVPVGLGDVMNAEDRLDGVLAQAIMSIPAVKGVEIGMGFSAAGAPGSAVHDEIFFSRDERRIPAGHGPSGGFYRKTNNAGGVEGGMTNGEPVVLHAAFKPIPTMMKPKMSIDLVTKKPFEAAKERSDVCIVPAGGVVMEASVAFVLARAFLAKFGGDSLSEIQSNYNGYLNAMNQY